MIRKKVYISCTWDDLQFHRRAAESVLRQCGHVPVDSYAAGAYPVVEQCLTDVDRCDLLAGIVGERYGYVPPDGDPRSITHREFDRAAEKERFIFLKIGHADLAQSIVGFRAALSAAVTPVYFEDLDDFTAKFRKTIKDRVGVVESFEPLLPYFCDRRLQYQRIEDKLRERREKGDMRMRIFVVHGDELQSGAEFIQVLYHKLRSFSATRDIGEPQDFELLWPPDVEGSALQHSFDKALADAVLKDRHAPIERVQEFLIRTIGPVLIHTWLSTTEYQRLSRIGVEEFCKFCETRLQFARSHPLIAVLRIEYELPRPSMLNRVWSPRTIRFNRAIQNFLEKEFTNSDLREVLPELPRIPVNEAVRWANEKDVRKHFPGAGCGPRIREIYRTKFAREPEGSPCMHPLAGELTRMLEERI